jgi:hypothetical protein
VEFVQYSNGDCTGSTIATIPISPTLCLSAEGSDDIGDDVYYSPGGGASMFTMGCSGTTGGGGGGGSSNSNALSGGAIAGIVLGGVAFLAICVGAAVFLLGAGCGFGGKAAMASQAQSAAADNGNL